MSARRCLWLSALLIAATACDPSISDGDTSAPVEPVPTDVPQTPQDADGDGFAAQDDCDDGDPSVYPGAVERCDMVDRNCDSVEFRLEDCPCERVVVGPTRLMAVCSEDLVSWDEAADRCAETGMDLLVDVDAAYTHHVGSLSETRRTWIGLSRRADDTRFVWVDGRALSQTAWGEDQPSDQPGPRCARIDRESRTAFAWEDAACDSPAGFACGWIGQVK